MQTRSLFLDLDYRKREDEKEEEEREREEQEHEEKGKGKASRKDEEEEPPLRWITVNDQPRFVLADVIKLMGLKANVTAISKRLDEEDVSSTEIMTSQGKQRAIVVTPLGLLQSVLGAGNGNVPRIKRFRSRIRRHLVDKIFLLAPSSSISSQLDPQRDANTSSSTMKTTTTTTTKRKRRRHTRSSEDEEEEHEREGEDRERGWPKRRKRCNAEGENINTTRIDTTRRLRERLSESERKNERLARRNGLLKKRNKELESSEREAKERIVRMYRQRNRVLDKLVTRFGSEKRI